jgi:polyisoprenyl-phosphate glycosyltransferase
MSGPTPPPELLVVTPVFEDVEAASQLFVELRRSLGGSVFVVAVDDGSIRAPLPVAAIAAAGLDGVVLTLRRNVGHQRAIATGLAYVADRFPAAQRIVVMDSDGEDVPATIPALLERLERGDVDVVVASRRSRVETLRFRLFYLVYKWLFSLLTGRTLNFGNFMAMNATGLRRLAAMGEVAIHVAGSVLLSRLRWDRCPLDRGARYAGHSKMNFVGLALHGFKGLMVFAEDVLVRVGAACALVAAASLLASALAIVLKSINIATPGWFSVALGILVLVFLQTGAITLMTLMLTGVVRGSSILPLDYRLLLAEVKATEGRRVAA